MIVSRARREVPRSSPALDSESTGRKGRGKKRESAAAGSLSRPSSSSPFSHFSLSLTTKKKQAVKLKTKKRPKKLTPSDKKHVGATYPALPPPPPAYTILKAGASN